MHPLDVAGAVLVTRRSEFFALRLQSQSGSTRCLITRRLYFAVEKEMSCAEVREAVYSYVACSLSAAELELFYRHLVDCKECLIHVTCYRSIVNLLRESRRLNPATSLTEGPASV